MCWSRTTNKESSMTQREWKKQSFQILHVWSFLHVQKVLLHLIKPILSMLFQNSKILKIALLSNCLVEQKIYAGASVKQKLNPWRLWDSLGDSYSLSVCQSNCLLLYIYYTFAKPIFKIRNIWIFTAFPETPFHSLINLAVKM